MSDNLRVFTYLTIDRTISVTRSRELARRQTIASFATIRSSPSESPCTLGIRNYLPNYPARFYILFHRDAATTRVP